MFIFDAHLDLAMNAIEWNRDLTWSVEEIRKSEVGMTDKPDRRRNTVSFDATHLCDQSFWETMAVYNGPIWASHNNCRALIGHNRQFSDAQLKELISRNAVIGIALDTWMMVPNWVRGQSTPQSMNVSLAQAIDNIDNIDHICQIAGNANHVGIGADLDGRFGTEQSPMDVDTIADLQKFPGLLEMRGYSMEEITKIMHKNFIAFLRQTWA